VPVSDDAYCQEGSLGLTIKNNNLIKQIDKQKSLLTPIKHRKHTLLILYFFHNLVIPRPFLKNNCWYTIFWKPPYAFSKQASAEFRRLHDKRYRGFTKKTLKMYEVRTSILPKKSKR
jgi:hypothetical protein